MNPLRYALMPQDEKGGTDPVGAGARRYSHEVVFTDLRCDTYPGFRTVGILTEPHGIGRGSESLYTVDCFREIPDYFVLSDNHVDLFRTPQECSETVVGTIDHIDFSPLG